VWAKRLTWIPSSWIPDECFSKPQSDLTDHPAVLHTFHKSYGVAKMASMLPPPQPQTNPSKRPIGITPSSNHDSDSDPDSDSDTATPIAGAPATPRYLAPNPQEVASQRLLDQLRSTLVEGYPPASNYCCGGNVLVSANPPTSSQDSSKAPIVSPPVILRFDDTATGRSSKLHFPPDDEDEKGKGKLSAGIEDLQRFCTTEIAAEDDGGTKDTRAESRGRSARMEREKFAVDFHPADFGILDAIKQVLLPGAVEGGIEAAKRKEKGKQSGNGNENWSERKEHRGVRAELCQLNVSVMKHFTTCNADYDVNRFMATHRQKGSGH
jgi:hypothetical protein